MRKNIISVGLCGCFFSLVAVCHAVPIVPGSFNGSEWVGSYENREATAKFAIDNSQLKITLTNTSNSINDGSWNPNEGLAGVFFGAQYLGEIDKVLAYDVMAYDPTLGYLGENVDVSGEFGYLTDADVLSAGTYPQYLVSASSLDGYWVDPLGPGSLVDPDKKLTDPPKPPDGPDFLILNTGDPGQCYSGIPWISNYVEIYWNLVGTDLEDLDIKDVYFAYGTDYGTPVPEPSTILLIGTGLVGLVGFRKKFKK